MCIIKCYVMNIQFQRKGRLQRAPPVIEATVTVRFVACQEKANGLRGEVHGAGITTAPFVLCNKLSKFRVG